MGKKERSPTLPMLGANTIFPPVRSNQSIMLIVGICQFVDSGYVGNLPLYRH